MRTSGNGSASSSSAFSATDRHMEFNPPPDSTIHAGDKLVVLGRADSLKQLEVEASKI